MKPIRMANLTPQHFHWHVSDRIAVVHRGELLACDVPGVVVADERVRDAYLGAEL